MDKVYQHQKIESFWQKKWETCAIGKPSGQGPAYCIVIPPPNVTGTLHMGHGFQLSLMDCLIRYHRMNGHNTLWQVGTDHAGIATQMVVAAQLQRDGIQPDDLGREAFVEKIWQWKSQSGQTILNQMKRLGASVDWSRERFTLDPAYSEVVKNVFVDLYQKGLIFRGKRLVNWDPKLMTAVSDLEVINEERTGHLWYIRYPIQNQPNRFITVATTRPETLLGDQAVAVHPEDTRYQDLIGTFAHLPLTDRIIPIVADPEVDQTFGTGCVKITPAHDFNDFAMGQRHNLPQLNILTPDGKINDLAPEMYRGLDRFEARQRMLIDLESQNLLEKTDPHTLSVPIGDRSGVILEPYLTDQWFVKGKPLADPALAVVAKGEIAWLPENWINTYNHWLNNIQDWCISRRLWWGHRIPAWYDADGNVYVGLSEADVRQTHQLDDSVTLHQEEDVLDTWFSSALWPFATLDWPNMPQDMSPFYPNSVLVTGFDIIFFWVARMIMMGLHCTGKIPFHHVYITGLIRDFQGKKMSKSKGNVIDPIDLIDGISLEDLVAKRTQNLMQTSMAKQVEKSTRKAYPKGIEAYGTDALRFTFCALASTGRDIRFDLQRLEGYRNFCNKLWNASRFVLGQLDENWHMQPIQHASLSTIDQWIMHRLHETIQACHQHMKAYRFDLFAKVVHEFVWHDYCDWYLEWRKIPEANCQQDVLFHVLDQTLRLLHPVIPYITEEIWQKIKLHTQASASCLALADYPSTAPQWFTPLAASDVSWLKQCISQIRTLRNDLNMARGQNITLLLTDLDALSAQRFAANEAILKRMLGIDAITTLKTDAHAPISATTMVDAVKCMVPLAGLVDERREIERLEKAIVKLQKKVKQAAVKLSNNHYCQNAPADLVETLRTDHHNWELAIEKYQTQIQWMTKLLEVQNHDQ